jgi:hypothetical protein
MDAQLYNLSMSKTEDSFINPADFNSIELKISLLNLTTKAEIKNGKRSFGVGMDKPNQGEEPENFEVHIFEFLEDGFMLEVPSKTCAVNHAISLEINSENAQPKLNFSANLKVISMEKISTAVDLIQVKFTQKSIDEWEKLQNLYGNRQTEINQFMKDVKGLESE